MFYLWFFMLFYFFSFLFFFFSLGVGSLVFSLSFFSMGSFSLPISFCFDGVSLGFFSSVSLISGLVFFYSGFYMAGLAEMRRFLWLVFGFVVSMFLLVFSCSFFLVMVGWDGLGLISFCLVVFYGGFGCLESGLITVFSNRVGDVFFVFSFFCFFVFGDFFVGGTLIRGGLLFFFLLFLGGITKSAQFPFSSWLPAAMAAPTPVSSLVHSSTLVTAGVYVFLRFYGLFFFVGFSFLKVVFLLTMSGAGLCALVESDFKKIVAMSTLSQLGMMMFVLSLGCWEMSFVHMICHALFKSMLFLGVGSLMMGFLGGQDSRFYGGDGFSFSSFLYVFLSCVCLMGFPFFVGFYSKDLIIIEMGVVLGVLSYLIFLGGCLMTVCYSFRLLWGSYSGSPRRGGLLSWGEESEFSFSVSFLFLGSGLVGLGFFWSFLHEVSFFFGGFDYLVGLFLVFFGFFLGTLGFPYYLSFFSFLIFNSRWMTGGGTSFLSGESVVPKADLSWFEVFGGQGVYGSAFSFFIFGHLERVYLGMGVVFFFVIWIFLWLLGLSLALKGLESCSKSEVGVW